MVKPIKEDDFDVTVKFGGGLNTRASEDEINPREAAEGINFDLDLQAKEFVSRKPFDLVGTVPNASEIRGGASLLKSDGTVSFLIQAGNTVYEWDGDVAFTSKGTVDSQAKLRGHWRSHNWQLDDLIIITDLNLVEGVLQWDGTTLSTINFTDENSSSFGSFYAKYCSVVDERVLFSACRDVTTNKHMMVGSARSDYTQITVADRPSSSLSDADPFFLLIPDLKPINGHVEAFNTTILSTEKGKIFQLTGSSAQDFAFDDFYPGSSAAGEESLVYIGNDIIYGRPGRIESVSDTDRFGDTESDDLTLPVYDIVKDYIGWTNHYNSRINRVYLFPTGESEVWVYDTSMKGSELSPWMRWQTKHSLAFQPTFAMSMLDPADGLEYLFMGDSSGNLYRMEGSGAAGDGGAFSIETSVTTGLLLAQADSQFFDVEGQVKYRKDLSSEIEISLLWAGESIFTETCTVAIPAAEGGEYYNSDAYYGGEFYYGTVTGKLSHQPFYPAGQGNSFQVRLRTTGVNEVRVNQIGLRFGASSK